MIPGIVIGALTFPGFVIQNVARRLWCDLLGIQVYEARYFRGMIVHEPIDNPTKAALVAFAPLSVNTLLCAVLLFPVYFSFLLKSNAGRQGVAQGLLSWLGFAIGMRALPTRATVNSYIQNLPAHLHRGVSYFILRSAAKVFVVIDLLKYFWVDAIYVALVGMATPWLITRIYMAFQHY
jgi:hypothetical protein